jgi:Fibronectin type III domain
MPTTTLTPISDVSISGWTANGFSDPPTAYATALTDSSDATYMAYAGASGNATLNLSALPGGVVTITGVAIRLRCYVNSTKNSPKITAQVKTSGGSALSGSVQFSPTTSFSNISQSATVSDSNPSDWGSPTIVITSDGLAAENVSEVLGVDITYTSTSPPGTPTNLVASYAGPTSTTLTWTQGSGTVTDNKYETSADGTNFGAAVDIGSAVTTITVTGLNPTALYFFRVAASNSGGDSAYTTPVPWVTGSAWTGQISASSDDAFQNAGGAVTIADATDSPVVNTYLAWRFLSVGSGPAQLTSALLYLYASSVSSPAGNMTFDCQASLTPATFAASANNLSSRSLTGSSVLASASGLSTGWGVGFQIVTPVQAALDQVGWASGDNLAIIMAGGSGLTGVTFEMQDGNGVQAAVLALFGVTPTQYEGPIGSTMQLCQQAASQAVNDQIGYYIPT